MSEYLQSIIDHKRNEVKTISDDIRLHMFNSPFEDLNKDYERKNGRGFIQESIFKEYYLPRMLGIVRDPYWIASWQRHSTTLAGSVEVVHDSTQEVLFVVPGLLQTLKLSQYNRDGKQSLREVTEGSIAREGNKAYNSELYLFKGIEPVANAILKDLDLNDERRVWLTIVNHYGYNPDGSLLSKSEVNADNFLGESDKNIEQESSKDLEDDGVEFEF